MNQCQNKTSKLIKSHRPLKNIFIIGKHIETNQLFLFLVKYITLFHLCSLISFKIYKWSLIGSSSYNSLI